MNTWYSTATTEGVTRIERAWKDAPTTDLELCELLFDTAREQVIAYAPKPDAQTGEIVPGPVTVSRRNRFSNPQGSRTPAGVPGFSQNWNGGAGNVVAPSVVDVPWSASGKALRRTWTAVAVPDQGDIGPSITGLPVDVIFTVEFDVARNRNGFLSQDIYGGATGVVTVLARSHPTQVSVVANTPIHMWATFSLNAAASAATDARAMARIPGKIVGDSADVSNVVIYEGPRQSAAPYFDGNTAPFTDANGRTYSHAWEGAENASPSVETYRPDVFVPTYPSRLVYAQLQQARNLWLAGRTDESGAIGGEFSYVPRPLDKTIKNIIRPEGLSVDVL